jgi:hypothetical protein
VAACEDPGPTAPFEDLPETLTVEEQLTLEVLSDPTSTEVALAMATTQIAAAHRRGRAWSSSEDLTAQAENHFRNAEQAFAQGDLVRAMEQHREARRVVAQAMQAAGGSLALQAQYERLEAMQVMVQGDPESFQDPQGFALQLGKLAEGARYAYRNGNRIQACQAGVLAEQAVRTRQRDQDNVLAQHPEIKVQLGAAAIALAREILGEGAKEAELDLLAVAEELQAMAEEALGSGEVRWAVHYARIAEWWALKAVVLPDGISDEEAAFILELAQAQYAEAVAAVGTEPDEIEAALLEKAARMLAVGEENLANGACRGLGALWQAAVISSFLVG